MSPLLLSGLFDVAGKVLDRLFPDPAQKAAAQIELFKLQQSGELQQMANETSLALAQIEVNKVEAASSNLFASSWRPAVGWCCVIGLGYTFLAQPLLAWYSLAHDIKVPPALDIGTLLTLLGGMLGFGTLRTFERTKGVIPPGN